MDIIDIDELLKNDSFTCLEGKTHDDVTNILRQWKQNNQLSSPATSYLPSNGNGSVLTNGMQQKDTFTNSASQTTNKFETIQKTPANNNQTVSKLNTKTFTRPKRKNAAGLDSSAINIPGIENDDKVDMQGEQKPMLQMEIGGLVTSNIHKSMLQDTSPPASICSSMDVSIDNMNNSLITSADFSNISFLQSTNSMDFYNESHKFLENNASDGYTLQDMIRDRKKLESLTLSGDDGALMKDSNIAQIDDISLVLSKVTSSCSTMYTSSESIEGTIIYGSSDQTFDKSQSLSYKNNNNNNITFNTSNAPTNTTITIASADANDENNLNMNKTYLSSSNVIEQAICVTPPLVQPSDKYDTQLSEREDEQATTQSPINFVPFTKSTPVSSKSAQTLYGNGSRWSQQQQQSQQQILETLNEELSPSLSKWQNMTDDPGTPTGRKENYNKITTPRTTTIINHDAYRHNLSEKLIMTNNELDMQHVRYLAQAEADLLAGDENEEEFEHRLDEFGRIELNAEQLKMKRSLETIKKRLNCALNNVSGEHHEQQQSLDITTTDVNNVSSAIYKSNDKSSSNGNIIVNERLLNRRCRLYDEANLRKLTAKNANNYASFILEKPTMYSVMTKANITTELDADTESLTTTEDIIHQDENVVEENIEKTNATDCHTSNNNRKIERREHCRNRFKTIKLMKVRAENVPCIDDEDDDNNFSAKQEQQLQLQYEPNTLQQKKTLRQAKRGKEQRYSHREQDSLLSVYNNDTEFENCEASNKYATYRKPKEKDQKQGYSANILPDAAKTTIASTIPSKTLAHERRSPSRPRFLSGLSKIQVVSKANSASELTIDKTQPTSFQQNLSDNCTAAEQRKANLSQQTKTLKSPMGIKSKSYGNLSSSLMPNTSSILCSKKVYHSIENATNITQPKDGVYNLSKQTGITGLRAPLAIKRSGLARPSSGYYNLNMNPKPPGASLESSDDTKILSNQEIHSKNLKSSSRSASNEANIQTFSGEDGKNHLKVKNNCTGIPKPSAQRPPTSFKRSGLPRPTSFIKR